jgi:hypothetical protein
MRRLARFFNVIMRALGVRRGARPEDIPKKLDPETLARAMEEARFLFGKHGVDVRSLAAGEEPDSPKPADGRPMPPIS